MYVSCERGEELKVNEFSFCTLTYNQSDYIVLHLESIKFQILNFGKGIGFHFLLFDDCSLDNTCDIVEKWLDENDSLFIDYRIFRSETNNGTVKNYVKMLRNVQTKWFKVLAGDDFYYKNSIFDTIGDSNMIISPSLLIDDKYNVLQTNLRFYRKMAVLKDFKKLLKSYLKNQYKLSGCISAPGVIFSSVLIDNGLFSSLEPFTLIEDAPLTNYLLNKKDTCIKFIETPLTVYRVGQGISTDINHKKKDAYYKDSSLSKELIYTKYNPKKSINLFAFRMALEGRALLLLKYVSKRIANNIRQLENINNMNVELEEYMTYLIKQANTFTKEIQNDIRCSEVIETAELGKDRK